MGPFSRSRGTLTVLGDNNGSPRIIGVQYIRKEACVDYLFHVGCTCVSKDVLCSNAGRLNNRLCFLRILALHRRQASLNESTNAYRTSELHVSGFQVRGVHNGPLNTSVKSS